ncbi:hypothetical protein Pan44_06120 [Caulifigura coniformis]|uniref:DUF1579 domain-containing protein n=1 Tax=Caulifigura coniformis TaxID=2527983 RepID=A0A517S8Z5_9PLAN|nr:hypothetical protein [Caulifigura coniformis]QDT52600.1 hypothetical protein Pan44_06120 [Caulifigura coniformis]
MFPAPPVAAFADALAAPGRSSEIPDAHDLYGWLIGSWHLDVIRYWAQDVTRQNLRGELHAGWVLEGRAIQDVWIMPRRSERSGPPNKQLDMYGTTIRAWDSSIEAWRISWSNPSGDHFEHQVGRRDGQDIVQIGQRPDGSTTRWRFTKITVDSFHWLGESQPAAGGDWLLEGEFLARRI